MLPHFISAEPFPHLVLDNSAPEETFRQVAAGFDEVSDDAWVRYDDLDERGKRVCNKLDVMPLACRDFLAALTSPTAATLCQWLTGIDGLVSDATLYGGGLHVTEPSGFLGVHLDNERHPATGLARRLNLIVYCTDWSQAGGWQDEWGGHLEPGIGLHAGCQAHRAALQPCCALRNQPAQLPRPHPAPRLPRRPLTKKPRGLLLEPLAGVCAVLCPARRKARCGERGGKDGAIGSVQLSLAFVTIPADDRRGGRAHLAGRSGKGHAVSPAHIGLNIPFAPR